MAPFTRRALLAGLGGVAATSLIGEAEAVPMKVMRIGCPTASPTPTSTGGGGAQSAVTLTPIDGETISGGVQSNWNSNGWYTRRGMTRATSWTGPKPTSGSYAGMDDPDFIPICTWNTDFSGTGFYDRMDDLGINGMMPAAGSVTLANNVSRGKWATVDTTVHPGGTISTSDDPGVTGCIGGEEPSTMAEWNAIISANNTWLASADGSGRYAFINFFHNLMNGDIDFTIYPPDMVAGNTNQITTCDEYWIAGAPNDGPNRMVLRLYLGISSTPTQAQCQRGSHYGSMLDSIRKNYTTANTSPFWPWIESGAPYTESNSLAITPTELKWAVWATLVHGARGIGYFCHTFRTGDPLQTSLTFNDNGYGGPGITGTGIYAAAKEVNLNALSIASVINSPFDGYFVYGDTDNGLISTSGFLTAVTSTNSRNMFSGVDASCKWHPTQQKHYILSTTRETGGATNIPVTFRMVDQGQTTAHPMFTGSDITISRGGAIPAGFCEFSDTFATSASYKCYRID